MFERLLHSDWSVDPKKRWLAEARRTADRWHVLAISRVGSSSDFVDDLFADGSGALAGFDFPIGLPAAYARQTGLACFREALKVSGEGRWSAIFDVAERDDEIAIERPFYPMRSKKGVSRTSLVERLGVESFEDLLRVCERKTDKRNAACSVFWTLGGNQVGKGAITGWREVVKPALGREAGLWPFDGELQALAARHRVVIAETYPAAAYEASGIVFRGRGKRSQAARRGNADAILSHCASRGIDLAESVADAVAKGFGASKSGEDPFDALAGLLLMVEVVEGRLPEAPTRKAADEWEGWILGV